MTSFMKLELYRKNTTRRKGIQSADDEDSEVADRTEKEVELFKSYAGISGHPEGSTPGQPKGNPRA